MIDVEGSRKEDVVIFSFVEVLRDTLRVDRHVGVNDGAFVEHGFIFAAAVIGEVEQGSDELGNRRQKADHGAVFKRCLNHLCAAIRGFYRERNSRWGPAFTQLPARAWVNLAHHLVYPKGFGDGYVRGFYADGQNADAVGEEEEAEVCYFEFGFAFAKVLCHEEELVFGRQGDVIATQKRFDFIV